MKEELIALHYADALVNELSQVHILDGAGAVPAIDIFPGLCRSNPSKPRMLQIDPAVVHYHNQC
jgi:hypothetical protein